MTISDKGFSIEKRIKIRNLIPNSLIDWEGMVVSTLYVGGCNFRCPFCYNADLVINPEKFPVIPEDYLFNYFWERKYFLDGVCLSGGEPTIYDDLPEFLLKIKSCNLKIKLDTNGSNPDKLSRIVKRGLVDYIAMDIKSCLETEMYQRVTGAQSAQMVTNIRESINIICNSGIDYEFRTTVVPVFHNEMTIEIIAREIKGARQYVLQNFVSTEELLDNKLADVKPYSTQKMEELRRIATLYVENCIVR